MADFTEVKTHEGGKQHQRGKPGLDQIRKHRRETFFRAGR